MKATMFVMLCLSLAACDEEETKQDAAVTADSATDAVIADTGKGQDKQASKPDNTNPPPKSWDATLTSLLCWCNKMPGGASNIIILEATLNNGSKVPITGVKAVQSSFQVMPSGTPFSISFKANPPFTDPVPAAGSAKVRLRAQGLPLLLPIPCKGTIKVTTSFSSNIGTTGPYTTAQATCQTVW